MFFRKKPRLSVLVNAYNMQRELPRTLRSLQADYQSMGKQEDYEVIIVDNGSTQALDKKTINAFGKSFHYHFIDTGSPSPCKALNIAARQAKGEWLMCCIDGARILSPRILRKTLQAASLYPHPFIYTLGMHLGKTPQNISMLEGYNQTIEDQLLATVDWQRDGYQLFNISSLALSSGSGFFSKFSESNCFSLRKKDYLSLGGFDEHFNSPGGGLVNLDFFNRIHEHGKFHPILLLGEATFHQFHGGVATNVRIENHPWASMEAEYQSVRGKPYQTSFTNPTYFGDVHHNAAHFLH